VAEGGLTDLLPRAGAVAPRRAATVQAVAEGVLVDLPPREAAAVPRRVAAVQEAAVARRAGVTTDGMAGDRAGFGLYAKVVTDARSPPTSGGGPGLPQSRLSALGTGGSRQGADLSGRANCPWRTRRNAADDLAQWQCRGRPCRL
jgi:hypothetical protein